MTGLCAAFALLASAVTHQNPDSILARAETAYRKLTGYRAEFSQEIVNPMLGGPERSAGVLFLSPPGGFAMRFTDPAGDRIVTDGTWMWIYTPSTVPGQVIRQAVPSSGSTSPNLFTQFVEDPSSRFRSSWVAAETLEGELTDAVRLIPVSDDAGYREATVWVGRRDGLVRRMMLVESTGQRRTIVFRKITPNALVPVDEVTFRVPRGVRVVTQ